MTPTQQGRFCKNCMQQVIDFSQMSDDQILRLLSQQQGKLCGRFNTEQLQRPLVETKIKKKKSIWMAMIMPVFFLFDTAKAQKNIQLTGDTLCTIQPRVKEVRPILSGEVHRTEPSEGKIVKGKVVDDDDIPVGFAMVVEKGKRNATTADRNGNFSLRVHSIEQSATLAASSAGYESAEKKIDLFANSPVNNIKIVAKQATLGGVVIAGYCVRPKKAKPIDTLKSTIRKILNNPDFKIYPNPATKAGIVNIELAAPGKYELHLLDNQSSLMMAEEIIADTKKYIKAITVPSNIAPGIYYLSLVDEQTRKIYTEKLVIQ